MFLRSVIVCSFTVRVLTMLGLVLRRLQMELGIGIEFNYY